MPAIALCLICFLLRHRARRHLASRVFVVRKGHCDFLADCFIFHDVLQFVATSSALCSLDVALSKSMSCVHNATPLAKRLTCGHPTADARSSM